MDNGELLVDNGEGVWRSAHHSVVDNEEGVWIMESCLFIIERVCGEMHTTEL